MVHWHWNSQICLVNVPFFITHFNFKFKSNSNKMVNLQWEHDNETKKIVSGSDKVWNNDGCAVYICLTKTKKNICKSPGHLGTYTGAYLQKKNYGQLLPLLLFLFIFNLNLFSWLASYDNSCFYYCCIELGPIHLWMRNGACQWNETIQSGFTLMCQDQSNTISTFHNSFNKIASILKWNVNNGTRAPFTEIDV